MRVAVDARYLRRPDVGISVYLRGVIARLRDAGAAVTLLSDEPGHARELARAHGARAVALPCRSGFAWEQVALARWLRRERPDAVIAGANYGLPLLSRGCGALRILVVHDLIPLRLPRLYLRQGPGWVGKYLLSLAVSLSVADVVLTPSEATARDVRRLRGRDVQVRMPDLPPGDRAARDASPPPGWPDRYVLYNGGRDPRKNVPRMLEAFAAYRVSGGDHHLVLMGRGYEGHRGALERLGVADAVHMTGFVPDDVKARGLAAAGAVLYPSSWEGFGLPLVEAFAAGVPVVSGRGGSQAEIGGDAAVYVDVGDPAGIADGIRAALAPAARERARREGPRRLAELSAASAEDPLLALLGQRKVRERSFR